MRMAFITRQMHLCSTNNDTSKEEMPWLYSSLWRFLFAHERL
jgi:hypothetical protein